MPKINRVNFETRLEMDMPHPDPERNICPPMAMVVTLPIHVDGVHSVLSGLCVYVGVSAFASLGAGPVPEQLLTDLAAEIQRRVNQ